RRLAVLGGQADRLRLTRQEDVEFGKVRDEIGSTLSPAGLGWKLGEIPAQDVVLCLAAILEAPLPQDWHAEVQRGAQSVFPVSAADLMPELHGPAIGARLRMLQARWLASGLRLDKDALLRSGND
ncbi:MAG: CCA tRNA nucleotidyltransferase, partial [Paracoccaceae bacterium]